MPGDMTAAGLKPGRSCDRRYCYCNKRSGATLRKQLLAREGTTFKGVGSMRLVLIRVVNVAKPRD